MMGVLPEYRNQRRRPPAEAARSAKKRSARGVELIEWTFDPLELKNAFFNIERLGAIVRRYVLNQYGTTTSQLHGGLPTDRCVAEWHVSTAACGAILCRASGRTKMIEARIDVPQRRSRDLAHSTNRSALAKIQQRISERFPRALPARSRCDWL